MLTEVIRIDEEIDKGKGRTGPVSAAAHDDGAESLQRYRNKRDPKTSNEPFAPERIDSAGKPALAAGETWGGDFVVHLHHATRQHFDLRLQVAGRLLSFAVPRGPSLDPTEKRLALQTEDHPFEYLDFEDVIPEGNYGAGSMIVWDTGRIAYLEHSAEQGLKDGKLDFVLYGYKLNGRFALVETGHRQKPTPKTRQWLLIKKSDAHSSSQPDLALYDERSVLSGMTVDELAHKSELNQALSQKAQALGAPARAVDVVHTEPMLCTTEGGNLNAPGWIYELKLDGVRILAEKKSDRVTLRYRKGRATQSYPEISRAVRSLSAEALVVDGEIVAFDSNGKPSFQRLAQRIHAQKPHDVKRATAEVPVTYLVFDLLQLGDRDLRDLPLHARKALLSELVRGKGRVRLLDHIANGSALFQLCEAQGLEGVVAKRADSPYRPGPQRTGNWIKIKQQRDDDFVVVGWTTGQGSRQRLGALELASFDGNRYVYRGRVGSGFDDAMLKQLAAALTELAQAASAAAGTPSNHGVERHFVTPKLVVSVTYLEWTDDGHLRQPIFHGLRADVSPTECRAAPREELLEKEIAGKATFDHVPSLGPAVVGAAAIDLKEQAGRTQLVNLEKIFWPDDGYTKGDLLEYYASIAPAMLPHLEDRPVMLVRYPDGISGKNFYQWNVPAGTPSFIRTLPLKDDEHPNREITTFVIDSVEALLHVINLGCIPLHVLAARASNLSSCDFLTLDLDPGEQPFSTVVRLTLTLKEILDQLALPSFVKTSGQAGMHVLVPLGPDVSFGTARTLADLIGRLLQLREPELSTVERRIGERKGRLFIDTGQTGRSRTIVAPYSVRAYPGATVSTPLSWEEVHLALTPHDLNINTVPTRVREQGDPMFPLLSAKANVADAAARLQSLFGL